MNPMISSDIPTKSIQILVKIVKLLKLTNLAT